jgi:hypothetical protein
MEVAVERFEPVYLQIGEVKQTEYGKRWFEARLDALDRFNATLKDVVKLAYKEAWKWPLIQRKLDAEGMPQNISSGISQYGMSHLIDHINGKTSFTMPAAVAMALGSAAPTSTTTGVWGSTETTTYTGYARQAIAGAGFNAATAATPSVATNASTITFGNCTAGTATFLGFLLTDNATINTGNALWYGTLTSVTISTTQTPPTVAAAALSLSMTGT